MLPLIAVFALSGMAQARDEVHLVGSATVNPFANYVGKRFTQFSRFKPAVIENTGTAVGMKRFCDGMGARFPDIVAASRRMAKLELETCTKNGAAPVVEFRIGYDGVVMAQSKKAQPLDLSLRDIYLALAKAVPEGNKDGGRLVPNPNRTWKDVNPGFPGIRIVILGPASGDLRDHLIDAGLAQGCKTFPDLARLDGTEGFGSACRSLRTDGAWIDGESVDKISERLIANPNLLGVVSFASFEHDSEELEARTINGVGATAELIAQNRYPMARPLFLYLKKGQVGTVPGLKEFLAEFLSAASIGRQGYLVKRGLVPLSDSDLLDTAKAGTQLPELKLP